MRRMSSQTTKPTKGEEDRRRGKLTLNSALVLVTEETVTGAPAAFRLAFKEAPEPTTMVPKERATGLAERVPFGP